MISISSIALAPLGALYGAAVRTRRALYRTGVFRIHRIDAPVISVGNLTTGGTGKTPLVESLARMLAREGQRVCILTRGYGRKNPRQRVVVSDGNAIHVDADIAGDEPLLLAENLLGLAAVVCDANRVSAAAWARANLASQVFILDDGFQYLALARDLNILVVDATKPWGSGARLLPGGRLREPLDEMNRADCVVVTRADQSTELEALKRQVAQWAPVIISSMKIKRVGSLRGFEEQKPVADDAPAAPGPIAAFCGIGNPESFFALLRSADYSIRHTQTFADHHWYTQTDIDKVVNAARLSGARALITTAKDAVKLRTLTFALPCYVAEIEMAFDNEDQLSSLLLKAIAGNRPLS